MSLGRVGRLLSIIPPGMVWVSWEMGNTEEGLGDTRLLMLAVQPHRNQPCGPHSGHSAFLFSCLLTNSSGGHRASENSLGKSH